MSAHSPHCEADTRGEQAIRRCLRCGRQFASEHRGHRVCTRCKRDEVWNDPPVLYGTPRGRAAHAGD